MGVEDLTDETVLRLYENIRQQVSADRTSGSRFVGETAKRRAQQLRDEIDRRRLNCRLIDWNV